MVTVAVCSHCRYHDTEPNIEINFREGKIYYVCPKCMKESVISLKVENSPYPKTKRMN